MIFNIAAAHPSWRSCLEKAIKKLPLDYLTHLSKTEWLPGALQIFNAFSLPLSHVNYVLLGESPYPRAHSANGFAFWDAAVSELWSKKGLSKQVNRATSLRNLIKMLLVANGTLSKNGTGQAHIALLHKKDWVQTNQELFTNFLNHGFLLLNATLVLQKDQAPRKDASIWLPFLDVILQCIKQHRPETILLLLGNIAKLVDQLESAAALNKIYAEHPYNLSFIHNKTMLDFFGPLHLLNR